MTNLSSQFEKVENIEKKKNDKIISTKPYPDELVKFQFQQKKKKNENSNNEIVESILQVFMHLPKPRYDWFWLQR